MWQKKQVYPFLEMSSYVVKMEACCSFKTIVGSSCSFDAKDRKRQTEIVPLLSCTKDISRHLSTLSFSGIENEVDLILSRVGFYKSKDNINTMTICPYHRATLGISWTRGGGARCRVPQAISNHGKTKGTWVKGDRGLGKKESSFILRNTGVFVPPGSGSCSKGYGCFCLSIINTLCIPVFSQVFARNADV